MLTFFTIDAVVLIKTVFYQSKNTNGTIFALISQITKRIQNICERTKTLKESNLQL